MQFGGTPNRSNARRNRVYISNCSIRQDDYPHSLSMYRNPPMMNISLQEFETYAYERSKVLHFLDSLAVSAVKYSETYNEKLKEFLRKNYPGFLLTRKAKPIFSRLKSESKEIVKSTFPDKEVSDSALEWRFKDHVSHFILRLAYCRSEDLRRWFLEKELDLFKFRFLQEGKESVQMFLALNNLTYNPISNEEKKRYADSLGQVSFDLPQSVVESNTFYRVPFTEVLNLVASRKVFISQGDCFVPQKEFLSIISNRFREDLSKALALTARSLPQLEEDDRLIPILRSFNQNAVSTSYDPNKNVGNVSVKDLDEMSQISYPLCMRQLHKALKDTHHLRHWGRMQYGLFLKGIGLTLEDSLKFWRQEFSKGIGEDKFEKEHAYNIRHSYGKEGKRTNYTPYSCMKIITSNTPGPQDHHGCPFKHTSADLLRQKLRSYKTSTDAIDEIIDLVRGQHFQIACQKYFEASHKVEDLSFQLTHPNHYFDESQKILKGEKPVARGGISQAKKEAEFVPTWSHGLPAKEGPSSSKKQKTDWDDSVLDQMMVEYSESIE